MRCCSRCRANRSRRGAVDLPRRPARRASRGIDRGQEPPWRAAAQDRPRGSAATRARRARRARQAGRRDRAAHRPGPIRAGPSAVRSDRRGLADSSLESDAGFDPGGPRPQPIHSSPARVARGGWTLGRRAGVPHRSTAAGMAPRRAYAASRAASRTGPAAARPLGTARIEAGERLRHAHGRAAQRQGA